MAKKTQALRYYEATGRRKSAVARVRLNIAAQKGSDKVEKLGKGEIQVNGMPAESYFPFIPDHPIFRQPLQIVDASSRFAISVVANGGGKKAQLEAVRLGLARALELADGDNRAKLKPHGLLSRDARVRERRKAGTGGRARRQKQSPKR